MSLKPPILTVGKFEFYSVTQTGISFAQETPRAEWLDVVKRLTHFYEGAAMARERTLMLLADALNFGERAFGEEEAQAVDGMRQALGLSQKTISNAKWAYSKIDSSLRKEGITLNHYNLIAALEPSEQERFIDESIKKQMTIRELRDEIAIAHPKTSRGKTRKTKAQPDDDADTAETILHKLSDCANWFKSNEPIFQMKSDLEELYKTYRRKWASGRKRK